MIIKKGKTYPKNGKQDTMTDEFEMDEQFARLASLIGEKARAKMLWHLLDGRAYTALELAIIADISKQSCSNHLKKLTHENILKVEKQGRHKYFRLYDKKVAKALEGIAYLTTQNLKNKHSESSCPNKMGIKYARSCYDHLAGYLGVSIQESFIHQGFLKLDPQGYQCTSKGIEKFKKLGIEVHELKSLKRKFAYPCLDWSERKHHVGGALGAALLQYMLENDLLRKKPSTRELILTSKGHQILEQDFNVKVIPMK